MTRRRPRRDRVLRGIGALVLAVAGCGRPSPADQPRLPDQVFDFPRLYGDYCAGCHGRDGRLGAGPPLNDPLLIAVMSAEEMKQVITDGRPGTLMPAFSQEHEGRLSDRQIDFLVAEMRTRWGQPAGAKDHLPAYALAKAPPGNKKNGARVFAVACAGCHGAHGQGEEAGAINDPAFLALVSDQFLRRMVITGRPDLGMPDYRTRGDRPASFKPLTSQEIADVVAYVAAWRQPYPQGPAGQPAR